MTTQELERTEILPERPFTHPDHTGRDRQVLRTIAAKLKEALEGSALSGANADPLYLEGAKIDGGFARLVISKPDHLCESRHIVIVGFFGQKRAGIDFRPLDDVDSRLIKELWDHEQVLSYCTLMHDDGRSSNLVVMASPDAKSQWRDSRLHAHAVREMAPIYYHSIRIYNGYLPQGLFGSGDLFLSRVKYYDYRESSLWRAERALDASSQFANRLAE